MSTIKDELIRIAGVDRVSDESAILDTYSKDHSFAPARAPRLLIKPESENQIQEIVQWANRTGTPLVPVSSGSPHFRGDTVPSTGGAVIVDLSGMKKILKIDRRNRWVEIEPGVTYPQLQQELAKEGMTVSAPFLPRHNKSVLASLLEREPTIIPRYQSSLLEPLRCLGVIWGNGEKFNTGSAASTVHLLPHGPGQNDWYRFISAAQGSMGIATWASLRCKLLPTVHKLFFVPAQKLDALLDFAYRILRIRYGDEFLFLNNPNLACIRGAEAKGLKDNLPPWVLILGLAGRERLPEQRVAYQEKDITAIAQECGLKLTTSVPGFTDSKMLETLRNSSTEPYWKLGYKGASQDIFFITTLNRSPAFINSVYQMAEKSAYRTSDIGIYIQPLQQGTSCHCEFNLPYDPNNQNEVARVQQLFAAASEELMKQGAFFSRPYGMWSDMVFSRNAATTIALRKLKKIFDPNNIMNPGKLCF